MLKRDDSRGMSELVATLLIILLTLVAIGLVWVVVKNLISDDLELAEIKKEFFAENLEITSLKIEGDLVSLSLKRTGGESTTKTSTHITETEIVSEVDIVSVVDLSGSMISCNWVTSSCCSTLGGNWQSGTPRGNCSGIDVSRENICTNTCNGVWVDRLTPAKEANKELINRILQIEGSRVGLVAYSTNVIPSASIDLTDNVEDLNNVIDSWDTDSWTCICCGINEASDMLQDQSSQDKQKKIIVMSDGETNRECPERTGNYAIPDAISSACDANSTLENLVIYTIGFGADANQITLKSIADCAEGTNLSALNVNDLVDAYTQVAQEIITTSVISNRFSYLYIVFYNETSLYIEKISEVPQNLQIRNYIFDLDGKLTGDLVKIEIFPVILLNSGKEEIGPLFDSWTAQE